MEPTTAPTKSEVIVAAAKFADLIRAYLIGCGVTQNADGFHAVALTGDEDAETIKDYEREYQPLAKLESAIRKLPNRGGALERDPDKDSDWK